VELPGVGLLHAAFFNESSTRRYVQCRVAENPGSPDFLWNFLALAYFMLLSLTKAAHADMSSAAWQKIRVRSG
jgi:hypothetical protein